MRMVALDSGSQCQWNKGKGDAHCTGFDAHACDIGGGGGGPLIAGDYLSRDSPTTPLPGTIGGNIGGLT
jgi:hypothetical protein